MFPRSMLALGLVSCLATACGMPMFMQADPRPPASADTFKVLSQITTGKAGGLKDVNRSKRLAKLPPPEGGVTARRC